jgi:hypothetical protein
MCEARHGAFFNAALIDGACRNGRKRKAATSKGTAAMSRYEGRVDEADETSWESTLKFVLTLIVTTVIVALAVTVLSVPLFGVGWSASGRPAAVATFHLRS